MAPKKRTTRVSPATTTTTTSVTNAQLQAMIDQDVTAALAARDAKECTEWDDSNNSGNGCLKDRTSCSLKFENQVKFATCTLHSVALTWWNTYVKTVGHDAAYVRKCLKKVGHLSRDCRSPMLTLQSDETSFPEMWESRAPTGVICPELKNQNYENQVEGTRARGMVHALGGRETNQDLNDMEEDINA
ncbi:hypothetical protein Tco_0298959 [Tanacetum coccineum]